ncbi:MAG: kdgK 2 [Verrucomicrobia bacterium]|nr:kdgK 2 [Verrucomicrobiota bacterium]
MNPSAPHFRPDPRPLVVCFGELLWDFLPAGQFPGGAPFNVAYHLEQLGVRPYVASAVGRGLLGDELLRRLSCWELETDGIRRHPSLPTGYVRAHLSKSGDAEYEIAAEVAWDEIEAGEQTLEPVRHARAIVFGSLAQRSPANRVVLQQLLAALPDGAERVLDVNFRPPHDDVALVRQLARQSTILKLNTEEADRLVGAKRGSGMGHETRARELAREFGCRCICLTDGARGAGLLREGNWFWEDARPVAVADTVGSGDAFLAAFLAGQLQGLDPAAALGCACRLGEWVASQAGATPDYADLEPAFPLTRCG